MMLPPSLFFQNQHDFLLQRRLMFAEFFIISAPTKNPLFIRDVTVFTSDELSLCHSVGLFRFIFVV